MKTCFNLINIPVGDLIKDEHPVEDIVAVVQFQTCIACGASIESLKLVDINIDADDDDILVILYMDAVVNGMTFKIIVHLKNDDQLLKHFLNYDTEISKMVVMERIRYEMN